MHVYKDLIRCKSVCDVHPGIEPYPLLARWCNRQWPDFVTSTACKKSRFGLKRGKKTQCVSNRCKDLFKRKKKIWGVRCTLWNRKHVPCFYGVIETRVEVWEMLWEHEPQADVSMPQLFRVLPNFHECFYNSKNGVHVFISFRKHRDDFYYQNVNSLGSRHHYVNSAR